MTELINNKNKTMQSLLALFNNGKALGYITAFTVIIPPISIYVDAVPQAKKYKVET